ncbi:MAG: DUF434 domain-containing protein [Spirochaetales bacterium]|nr:DUF434 domain-containing protein [Spirochaetales bacterium]
MSAFQDAIDDYRYLMNRDYPRKALLKLVGDRYRLSRGERNCLFRGVGKTTESMSRYKKIVDSKEISDVPLGIDWYNVLITVDSYLRGFPLFVADDGIVRDSSGVYGNFHVKKTTERAIKEIITCIEMVKAEKTEIYLDSPVSHSGDMAYILRKKCTDALSFPFNIEVVSSADYFLKNYQGIIASSDSIICDNADRIFDLARFVLFTRFHYEPPRLEKLYS